MSSYSRACVVLSHLCAHSSGTAALNEGWSTPLWNRDPGCCCFCMHFSMSWLWNFLLAPWSTILNTLQIKERGTFLWGESLGNRLSRLPYYCKCCLEEVIFGIGWYYSIAIITFCPQWRTFRSCWHYAFARICGKWLPDASEKKTMEQKECHPRSPAAGSSPKTAIAVEPGSSHILVSSWIDTKGKGLMISGDLPVLYMCANMIKNKTNILYLL